MNIPQLPTGDLYKFISIFGLVLIVFAHVEPNKKLLIYNKASNALQKEIALLTYEVEALDKEVTATEKNMEKVDKTLADLGLKNPKTKEPISAKEMIKNLNDKEFREKISFLHKYQDMLFPSNSKLAKIKSRTNQNKEFAIATKKKIIELKYSQRENESLKKSIQEQEFLFNFLFYIGMALVFIGFFLWYKLVQLPLDEKLSLELDYLKKQLNPEQKKIKRNP